MSTGSGRVGVVSGGDAEFQEMVRRFTLSRVKRIGVDPVQLVVVPATALPEGPAVLVRQPNTDPSDIVLIDETAATPEVVGAALSELKTIRAQQPESGAQAGRFSLVTARQPKALVGATQARATSILNRLTNRPVEMVAGIGSARQIILALPSAEILRAHAK